MEFVSKSPKSVQHGGTGTYFGRVKIGGKTFRESLETDGFTTANSACPIAGIFGHRIPFPNHPLGFCGWRVGVGRHSPQSQLGLSHRLFPRRNAARRFFERRPCGEFFPPF